MFPSDHKVEFRSAVIAAIVAAVVATVLSGPVGGAAVTQAEQYTSAAVTFIKGDRGKRGKRGIRGKRGLKGRTGARGPAGPAGPQGPAGLERLFAAGEVTPVSLQPGATGLALARCPAGTRVVWGGFNTGANPDVAIQGTSISMLGDTHIVNAHNNSLQSAVVTASALCANVALNRGFGDVRAAR